MLRQYNHQQCTQKSRAFYWLKSWYKEHAEIRKKTTKRLLPLFLICFIGLSQTAQPKFLFKETPSLSLFYQHQTNITKTISHATWQTFLNQHLVTSDEGIHLIDYPNLTKKDENLLSRYIDEMEALPIEEYHPKEQLAFWINLYNAVVVKTIAKNFRNNLRHPPTISPGFLNLGPFSRKTIRVKNVKLSLKDIEQYILTKIFHEPLAYYALNHGAIGAPNLAKKAFQGNDLTETLKEAATQYINSHRGVQVIEGHLIVSKFFLWHAHMFGETTECVLQHIRDFAKEPLQSQLKHINTINHYQYNWHVNTTKNEIQDMVRSF